MAETRAIAVETKEAYADWASTYDSDRNRTRDLDQIVTQTILGNHHFESILEPGCGTGKNTLLLARIGKRVHAMDFSAAMIGQARAKISSGNVEFTESDLTRPWPVNESSIDLVCCNLVLEHVAELAHVFAEATRVLEAGGQFFVSELHPFRQYQGTVATFTRGQQSVHIPAFVHHVSDFISASAANGLVLKQLNEWWHEEDAGKPPRLVTFLFEKPR